MKPGLRSLFNPVQGLFFILSLFVFTSFAQPPNLGILKKEIISYHDSGIYEKELSCVISIANRYLHQQAALNARQGNKKKLALVLDIDETSLSNYNHMVKRGFGGTVSEFHQDDLAADAPAISSTLALFNTAKQLGIAVFFVTGRPVSELKATTINLHRAGYNHWAGLYLRPNQYRQPSIIPFKTKMRESISRQGYTILASIGDQYSDLKGGFAQKVFKLPNPYYFLP